MPALDIKTAATKYACSEKTLRRRIKDGTLRARTEETRSESGRLVSKVMIDTVDLDALLSPEPLPQNPMSAHDAHVAAIRRAATPLTSTQIIRIRAALTRH